MCAKCPSASICVPCCPGSALACITSLLKAWAENGTPEVGLYCVPAGEANGDLGIVLLRSCEASYTRALGCAMCQAQRCVVIGPSVLAMPCSSPGFHGGAGLRLAAAISAAGSAACARAATAASVTAASAAALARSGRLVLRFIGQPSR